MNRISKKIKLGNKYLGGGEPVLIQSMVNIPSTEIKKTDEQVVSLEKAG